MCGNVYLQKSDLNTLGFFSALQNSKWLRSGERGGCTLKIRYSRKYADMNINLRFCCGDFTPKVCRSILGTICIVSLKG